MWHFDNAYIGDVYIYPMLSSGFEENNGLKAVHALMRFLHWPLYVLSWIAVAMLVKIFWASGKATNTTSASFWPIALSFAVFLAALSIIAWLPRYTIPMRPVSYVLASFALYSLVQKSRAPKSPRPP
jgi:ABC-type transport system involved in multi-copper enzyme maturation permease subunit